MAGTLYLLRAHPAAILSLDLDDGMISTILADLDGVPDGIQVDEPGNAIYWTNMGAWPESGEDFLAADGTIERCDLDGGDRAILVGGGAIITPKQMQFDAAVGLLYWCDREGMAIWRCRSDGADLIPLLRTGVWPKDAGDLMRHCVGIAIDAANGHIYWTQKGPQDGGLGRIYRMGLDMPAGATAESRDDIELLIDHLPEPIDLELDHRHGRLYWTDRGDDTAGGNSVNSADISTLGLTNHHVLATGLREGIGLALDPIGRLLFVSDLSGAVRVLPLDGGELTTISELGAPVTGVAFLPGK